MTERKFWGVWNDNCHSQQSRLRRQKLLVLKIRTQCGNYKVIRARYQMKIVSSQLCRVVTAGSLYSRGWSGHKLSSTSALCWWLVVTTSGLVRDSSNSVTISQLAALVSFPTGFCGFHSNNKRCFFLWLFSSRCIFRLTGLKIARKGELFPDIGFR